MHSVQSLLNAGSLRNWEYNKSKAGVDLTLLHSGGLCSCGMDGWMGMKHAVADVMGVMKGDIWDGLGV
jgi:hypothetical protein